MRDRTKKLSRRVSKSGKVYYINLEAYEKRLENEKRKRREEGLLLRAEYRKQRTKPYCHDTKNQSYLKYYEKKCALREEYPVWTEMNREEWLEYYVRIIEMIYTDVDYKQYREETKTQAEREDDNWWDNKRRKEDEYDGTNDEYY